MAGLGARSINPDCDEDVRKVEAVVAAARATVHTLRENSLLSRHGAGRPVSYTAVAASNDAHSLLHMKEKCVMDGCALLALLRVKTGKDTKTWLSEWAKREVCQGVVHRCGPPPRTDQLGFWLCRLEMLRLAVMSAGSSALAEWAGATDEYEENKTQSATTMARFRVSWQMSHTCQAHAEQWRTTWGARFATARSQSTWVAMKFKENIPNTGTNVRNATITLLVLNRVIINGMTNTSANSNNERS